MEKRSLLWPTDKWGKQPPTNFVSCFENSWERPLGQCVSDSHPHTSEARIEVVNDRRTPCSAQVWMRTEAGMWLNFIVLKFRLGSASEPNVCSQCYDVLNEDDGFNFTPWMLSICSDKANMVLIVRVISSTTAIVWRPGTPQWHESSSHNNCHQGIRNVWLATCDHKNRGCSNMVKTIPPQWYMITIKLH